MARPRWLEVSMTLDADLGEAVSEVMARFTTNGVVIERGVAYNDAEDEGTPVGPVRVYGYILIDENIEEVRRRLEEALWHLGQIQPLPQPAYRTIDDENWMAAWKQHYHPIPIGKRLLILPAWLEQTDPRRIAVKIDPSMAFGTGSHPTTQLCMEMVEKYMRPGQPVIDVGCGSGILSIAALKLGASRALAVDIDHSAILATQENAAANEVIEHLETGLGSVAQIRSDLFSLRHAPLVMVNILAPVILRLFEDGLPELLSHSGVLVLSGILLEQADGIEKAAHEQGLELIERRQQNDWVALAFQQPHP